MVALQHFFDAAIEALDHAVGLRRLRRCQAMIDSESGAEFVELVLTCRGALVDIGRGQTYTDAAKRVRARGNIGKTGERREVVNGQTVADCMADFVPVVAARHVVT